MSDFFLYAPISKINEEKRTVAGWATTEELDKQSEIVDYNGSKDAFKSWQGNIREMHEPKAVGKAVEIIPNDAEKRIWVEAKISKGAEDTWQKCKDGTLGGFSIGGQTVQKTTQIVKDMSTGGSRQVSRITKYRLNELSLVDNPANPGCAFALIKSMNGIPYQTEIVEDIKKMLITEAEDPLKGEIQEHREKADSLAKKVLEREELDNLSDDDFGLIRKSQRDDVIVKERLIPMPDKVHAVRALSVLEKYNLTDAEEKIIHKKAQELLGAAYESHKIVNNRGGENDMSKEAIDKLTELITDLVKRMESMEKAFEGAHKPVAGAKAEPKESTYDPKLGESSPEQSGAADGVQTQDPKGAYPADGPVKAANPATSDLKTQEEGNVAPVKKQTEEAEAVVTPSAPEEAGAADDVETQDPKGAYPAKGPVKAVSVKEEEEVHKSDKSENDLSKLVSVVDSLRKRVDEVTERLSKPMPRKVKIEKNLTEQDEVSDQLRKDMETVRGWVNSDKALTDSQKKFQSQTLDKMLDAKFGKSL